MTFKLDNKLEFITDNSIKDKVIDQINQQQKMCDQNEKEKYRQFLQKKAEELIMLRRQRVLR